MKYELKDKLPNINMSLEEMLKRTPEKVMDYIKENEDILDRKAIKHAVNECYYLKKDTYCSYCGRYWVRVKGKPYCQNCIDEIAAKEIKIQKKLDTLIGAVVNKAMYYEDVSGFRNDNTLVLYFTNGQILNIEAGGGDETTYLDFSIR